MVISSVSQLPIKGFEDDFITGRRRSSSISSVEA